MCWIQSTSPPATVCLFLKYHMFLYQKEKHLPFYIFKMFLLFQKIQNPQAKSFLVFWREKTFTFSYRKDQNHVTFFLPSRKDHSDLGNDFFSLNKFKVLISGYTEIRCTRIMRLTRITIVTRNSRFAVLTRITSDSPEPQKPPESSE